MTDFHDMDVWDIHPSEICCYYAMLASLRGEPQESYAWLDDAETLRLEFPEALPARA